MTGIPSSPDPLASFIARPASSLKRSRDSEGEDTKQSKKAKTYKSNTTIHRSSMLETTKVTTGTAVHSAVQRAMERKMLSTCGMGRDAELADAGKGMMSDGLNMEEGEGTHLEERQTQQQTIKMGDGNEVVVQTETRSSVALATVERQSMLGRIKGIFGSLSTPSGRGISVEAQQPNIVFEHEDRQDDGDEEEGGPSQQLSDDIFRTLRAEPSIQKDDAEEEAEVEMEVEEKTKARPIKPSTTKKVRGRRPTQQNDEEASLEREEEKKPKAQSTILPTTKKPCGRRPTHQNDEEDSPEVTQVKEQEKPKAKPHSKPTKKFRGRPTSKSTLSNGQTSTFSSQPPELYYPEKILAQRRVGSALEFLVRWEGYPYPADHTWEAEKSLKEDAPAIVKEWISQSPGKKKGRTAKSKGEDKQEGEVEILEVEKIIQKRRIKGEVCYLVKWRGFEEKDRTWEQGKTLKVDVPELVEEFEKEGKGRRGRRTKFPAVE